MRTPAIWIVWLCAALLVGGCSPVKQGIDLLAEAGRRTRQTEVTIQGEKFYINGKPTYEQRFWMRLPVEGLLFNARIVQGIFDDLNPETRGQWAYPDTGTWDPERNTQEFVRAMDSWREQGLLAFTINLQGGSPQGYSQGQPWHNSAITETGELREDYMRRLERILDRADRLGMVAIVGIFYFGQDERIADEAAVLRAVDNFVDWLHDRAYRNVLIEVNNETDIGYDHAVLQPERVHEVIERIRGNQRDGYRYPVSTSYAGGVVPRANVVRVSDFVLLHGNGVEDPAVIADMVRQTRLVDGYKPMPILFNEDDHYAFDTHLNNMSAALRSFASWGYFDFRREGEPFEAGFQSVPVDWRINSPRKQAFFDRVKEITGGRDAEPSIWFNI